MRHIVETGTDTATLCFFDPAALRANSEVKAGTIPIKQLEALNRDGLIWSHETGADGSYLFHFYVEEAMPERIRKHAEDPQEIARFRVPGGEIWACGVEYAATDPLKAGLSRFDHMGGRFNIPAGDYRVTAWRTEWPDDMIEKAVAKRVGKAHLKKENTIGVITGMLFFGSAMATFVGVLMTLGGGLAKTGALRLGALLLVTWPLCLLLMRKLSRMQRPEKREVEAEFPSIIVEMTRL